MMAHTVLTILGIYASLSLASPGTLDKRVSETDICSEIVPYSDMKVAIKLSW